MNKKLIDDILHLKKKKKAVILVHNYQRPEIYEVADFLGDSLGLSKRAVKAEADIIVFAGVNFMAESAKLLNPDKKVLLTAKDATCPMADMITTSQLKELKKQHPNAAVVCYVNSTADVKAESDICCTSANAIRVVSSLKQKQIIFVPDKHLGEWVQKNLPEKQIIHWEGHCYVHSKVTLEMIKEAKKLHPDAKVVSHPECPMEVLEQSDSIESTEGMLTYCKNSDAEEFIIVTEEGMVNRLKREIPGKRYFTVCGVCFNMKYTTLQKVKESLEKEQFEVKLPKDIAEKARKALDNMLKVS